MKSSVILSFEIIESRRKKFLLKSELPAIIFLWKLGGKLTMKKNRIKVKAHDNRNEPHFDHLRNYHPTTITESRKFRKPKHKKNWMDEAEE